MNEAIEDAGLIQLKEYRNALRTDLSVALEKLRAISNDYHQHGIHTPGGVRLALKAEIGDLNGKLQRLTALIKFKAAQQGAWQADWSYSDRLLATLQTLLEREGLATLIRKARGIVADELKEAK